MDEPIRPDLGRILPKPILRRVAGADPPFAKALSVPDSARGEDFFVDVQKRSYLDGDETGFGLAQASAVAAKIAAVFVQSDRDHAAAMQRPDPGRVQKLTEPR